jgi:ribonuclease HI
MSEAVDVYTDGACKGNPGPGGGSGSNGETMKNYSAASGNQQRMELTAVIEALHR